MSAGDADQERGESEVEVVRLGGSLLLPDDTPASNLASLRTRLNRWKRGRSGIRVWIVGTGAWGERLRSVQHPLGLSDETCHWAAIGLMSVAGEIATSLIERSEIVRTFDDLRRALGVRARSRDVVFDSAQFLREVEPTLPGRTLPHDWSVTSDSIAARLAQAIDADTLTLLKSCPPPETDDPFRWREAEAVDGFFPQVVATRDLRWVDLSQDPPVERRYSSR